jgi:chloramphenicol 3-O-phosphotransferase
MGKPSKRKYLQTFLERTLEAQRHSHQPESFEALLLWVRQRLEQQPKAKPPKKPKPPVFLILGTPASGKSSVAKALMQRFERGVHLPVDDLRHFVVSGLADLGADIQPETWRQVALARAAASQIAQLYAKQKFAVAIDDFWHGETPDANYEFAVPVKRVLLLPNLETTLRRLKERNPDEGSFKVVLEAVIQDLHPKIQHHPKTGWLVVDSSQMSLEQTVDFILGQV